MVSTICYTFYHYLHNLYLYVGSDPDYAIRDVFNAIAKGNYPSWTAYVQIMTFEQAERFEFKPFDLTKIWPQGKYPLIKYPSNYFAEVEQLTLAPSYLMPGIEA